MIEETFNRLKGEHLRPGDIILSTTPLKLSAAIRLATNSDISHALLCVGAYTAIDATGSGVHSNNTQRLLFATSQPLYVLRYKTPLPNTTLLAITDFARSKVGTRYSTLEAMKVRIGATEEKSRQQFCSRLVAQAYASVGISLVNNPDFCSPEELKKSTLLVPVAGLVESVSEALLVTLNNLADVPSHMRSVTEMLLAQIRTIEPSIEGINDVIQYLRKHPQADIVTLTAFRDSGYLDAWRVEVSSKQWQYDYAALEQSDDSADEMRAYCEQVIDGHSDEVWRFEVNFARLDEYLKEANLATFSALNEVNLRMIDLLRQKVVVAKRWLLANTHNNI